MTSTTRARLNVWIAGVIAVAVLPACVTRPDTSSSGRPAPAGDTPAARLTLPVAWPFPSPSPAQIEEARACPSLLLQSQPAAARATPRAQPAGASSRACDLAHQAYRQAQEADRSRSLPEAGIVAFKEAIQINPAFLFHEDLFYRYLDAVPLVSRPPVADQPIEAVEIRYAWAGLGDPLRYSLRIDDAGASPQVTLLDFEGPSTPDVARRIPADTVQALAAALTDFVPVSAPHRLVNCTDNAPDWTVTLRFRDGSALTLITSRSNMIPLGGPWQMQLDGVWHIQLSGAFADAVRDLVDAANMPLGQPAGMFCFPAPVFTAVYGE